MPNLRLIPPLALALAMPAAEAADLSAADKTAINDIAVRWRTANPKPTDTWMSRRSIKIQEALNQPGTCKAVKGPRPLPSGLGTLAVETLDSQGSPIEPRQTTHVLDIDTGLATVVRESATYPPQPHLERSEDFSCETWTDSAGNALFRLSTIFRLNEIELAEARERWNDLKSLIAGGDPVKEFQQSRCPAPAQASPHGSWEWPNASQSLLGHSFVMPAYQRRWANTASSANSGGDQTHRLRMAGEDWKPLTHGVSDVQAVVQLKNWIDQMERVQDTSCEALHAEADKRGRAHYAEIRSALEGWVAQARLLHGVCAEVPGWKFLVPEIEGIKSGYIIEHVDRLHQRDVYTATAVDIERRRVLAVSVPQDIQEPRAWFSGDPDVQASCQIIAPGLANEASAYLQVIQSAEAEPGLLAAAEDLVRHAMAGQLQAERKVSSVPYVPMHTPPREQVRQDGRPLPAPGARGNDPVYARFAALLYESAAYKKIRGH